MSTRSRSATPWLNPNAANPLLVFEIRLPAGTALPNSARDIAIELQTDLNRMPGEPRFNQFRRDGDRPVIAGDVELAFRTAHRQLEIKRQGQPDRLYGIGLTAGAPHAAELGPWQPQADGGESAMGQMAGAGMSHACPARLPGSRSKSCRDRLNLDTSRATHSRERRARIPPSVEPARGACRPQSVWYAKGAGRIVYLRLPFAAVPGNQSEPWPRFAISNRAEPASRRASDAAPSGCDRRWRYLRLQPPDANR